MTTPADTRRQQEHASRLLAAVSKKLHLGKPSHDYLPALREVCHVVAAITAAEVARAHDAQAIAEGLR